MLSLDHQRLLQPHLVPVDFLPDAPFRPADPANPPCHFIEDGLVAVITRVGTEQRPVEVGMVGRGGMLGISVLFGMEWGPHMGVALTAGRGQRIDARVLRRLAATSESLRDVLMRYACARMTELMHISGCNACHTLEQRVARWVLTASDRLGQPNINVTHSRVATLLGVRRAGVTLALHTLEGGGAIRSRRARIEIRDRARLERLSCGCDRAIQASAAHALSGHAIPEPAPILVPIGADVAVG